MKGQCGIRISEFEPWMQGAASDLIARGLSEHFGSNDPAQNPDLRNIAESYRDAVFLVAMYKGSIVATGALVRERAGVSRIVRMSVTSAMRRKGIGSRMLDALIYEAVRRGDQELILETTADWIDANQFYVANGFRLAHTDLDRNEANYRLLLLA